MLGAFEEVFNNNAEYLARNEMMENDTTDQDDMVEEKGFDAYAAEDNCGCVYDTNGRNPVQMVTGQRRHVANHVTSQMKDNDEYFLRLRAIMSKCRLELRACKHEQ